MNLKPILLLAVLHLAGCFELTDEFGDRQLLGRVQSPQITEASGIAASPLHADILWAHNDSGSGSTLYALDTQAQLAGQLELESADAVDWEDIAASIDPVTGQSFLYIADIGDNLAIRDSVSIYKAAEPANLATEMQLGEAALEKFEFRYPDGPRDAEALMVDPLSQDMFVISKWGARPHVYRIPQNSSGVVAEWVTSLPALADNGLPGLPVVAADISPDGSEILIKTYNQILKWDRLSSETIAEALNRNPVRVSYKVEKQGEAVGWASAGDGYFTLPEGKQAALSFYARF